MASVRRGIPLLKDIPLLSYIFAYNLKTVKKKELVIFIEAGIVPRLLDRKASKADLLRYLERQRQQFRDIKSPNRKSGRKGNTAVGRRTSQSRP
jgi:type II secretory pathway component GspD/PulD (secretin)